MENKATEKLNAFLKSHDIEADYCEADWKDTEGLLKLSHELFLKHPGWYVSYIGGDDLGIDSNFILITSKPVSVEVAKEIMEMIENEGAELELMPETKKADSLNVSCDTHTHTHAHTHAQDLAWSIVKWVYANAERESIFLSADPLWSVNAHNLLDFIAEQSGISVKEMDEDAELRKLGK